MADTALNPEQLAVMQEAMDTPDQSLLRPMPGPDPSDLIALASMTNGSPTGVDLIGNPHFQIFKNHPGINNAINQGMREAQWAAMSPQERMLEARMSQENSSAMMKALALAQTRKMQMAQQNAQLQETERYHNLMADNWAKLAGIKQQTANTNSAYRDAQLKALLKSAPLKKELEEAKLEYQKLRNDPHSFLNKDSMVRTLSWLPRNFGQFASTLQEVYGQTIPPNELQKVLNEVLTETAGNSAAGQSSTSGTLQTTNATPAKSGVPNLPINYIPRGQPRDFAGNPVGTRNYTQSGPPTSQRVRGQQALDILNQLPKVQTIIDKADARHYLGPAAGTWRDVLQKVGLNSELGSQLLMALTLTARATGVMHFGGRATGEELNSELDNLLKESATKESIEGALKEIGSWAHTYAQAGGQSVTQANSPYAKYESPAPSKKAPQPPATHRFNPATGKIEEIQ